MDEQLDMATFHERLWDESAGDQLIIILKELIEIEDPEMILTAVKGKPLGFWSGWAM